MSFPSCSNAGKNCTAVATESCIVFRNSRFPYLGARPGGQKIPLFLPSVLAGLACNLSPWSQSRASDNRFPGRDAVNAPEAKDFGFETRDCYCMSTACCQQA